MIERTEVLVLTPARHRFLDRWASDSDPACSEAQRSLVLSVASLAQADVVAAAHVGDENLVQAVEDELRTFPATGVIMVTGLPERDIADTAAVAELQARLQTGCASSTIWFSSRWSWSERDSSPAGHAGLSDATTTRRAGTAWSPKPSTLRSPFAPVADRAPPQNGR